MPSNDKTSIGLNKWILTDLPDMADFNRDNEILDSQISQINSNKANKDGALQANLYAERSKKVDQVIIGSPINVDTLLDFNTYSIPPNSPNSPSGDSYFILYVSRIDGDPKYVLQFALYPSGYMFMRSSSGGVFGAWKALV